MIKPVDISDAIVEFYSQNREKEFSKNTAEEKKKFTWSSFVNGIDQLIKIVMKSRNPALPPRIRDLRAIATF